MRPFAQYSPAPMDDRQLQEVVGRALAEDVGAGDLTTTATVDEAARARR